MWIKTSSYVMWCVRKGIYGHVHVWSYCYNISLMITFASFAFRSICFVKFLTSRTALTLSPFCAFILSILWREDSHHHFNDHTVPVHIQTHYYHITKYRINDNALIIAVRNVATKLNPWKCMRVLRHTYYFVITFTTSIE